MIFFQRYFFTILFITIVQNLVFSQGYVGVKEVDAKTKKFYDEGQKSAMAQAFGTAKSSYRKALEITPNFQDAMIELAGIYFSQKNEDSCVYFLNAIKDINPKPSARVYYTLATLYYNRGDYELAQVELQKYLGTDIKSAKSAEDAKLKLANCVFAIEAKKKPRLFSPIRLSDSINTYRPEYLPSISADEELLVFSRMIDRQEDLYYSQWNKDHWSRAQPLEGVNTEKYNEAGHCVSADGKTIVFTGCNMPGGLGSCDLYISYFKNGRWTQPANLDSPINTPGWESQPSLSADGNVLYFSSERPGGYGLRDIWHTEKSASGRWSTPKNIGAPINTTRNDSSPFIHADNQTLYFMSDGLPGMGGTDLFFSKRIDTEHWDVPINLGYPINTIGNEGALVVNIDGDKAYYTSTGAKTLQDKDGLENTDIYSFELDKEIRPQSVSFFKALVLDATSSKPLVSGVKITDIQKNLSFYNGNTSDDGTALVIMPKGDQYGIQISAQGYIFISESVKIPDSANVKMPYISTYKMERISNSIGKTFPMRNIFFESGSDQLSSASNAELGSIFHMMKENPDIVVQIDGHTDNIGGEKDNLLLSQNRAKAVMNELIKRGIPAKKILAKGFGESKPLTDNSSEGGRQINRRTEFTIISL